MWLDSVYLPPGCLAPTVPSRSAVPPLLDQKPPVGVDSCAGPSPPSRPVPGLSSISGVLPPRPDSSETGDSSSSTSGGPEPCLLEPLQEMTEGEEPLQVRRQLNCSPATEGSDSPASGVGGTLTHRGTPDSAPPAKRIKVGGDWRRDFCRLELVGNGWFWWWFGDSLLAGLVCWVHWVRSVLSSCVHVFVRSDFALFMVVHILTNAGCL